MIQRAPIALYEPQVPGGYQWAFLQEPDKYELLYALTASPLANQWTPLRVDLPERHEETGEPLKRSTMPWIGAHVLVLRDEAIDLVGPVLSKFGELLPLECNTAELALVHITHVLDILDESQSDIDRFPSDGSIMDITKYSLQDRPVGAQAFKLPQRLRGPILLTDDLASRLRDRRVTGTEFRLVPADAPSGG